MSGSDYVSHPLWNIHDLSRIYKHREILAVSLSSGGETKDGRGANTTSIRLDGVNNVAEWGYLYSSGVKLEVGAVPCRFSAIPIDSNRMMNPNIEFGLSIAFSEGTTLANKPVIPSLESMCDFVENQVISPLSKFL